MAACLSCGAQLDPRLDRCPLCGTPAGATDPDAVEAVPTATPEAHLSSGAAGVCSTCGRANPPDAHYCNACGAPLPGAAAGAASEPARTAVGVPVIGRAVPGVPTGTADAPPSTRPSSEPGRRALGLVAAGVAVVALLYGLTWWSNQQPAPADPPAEIGAAAAIPDGPAPPLPDTLQAAADRQAAAGTPGGYYESGRYYLTAAFEATGTDPQASAQWARRAREEFQQSLELREDPDVRLALAEALRFDPSAPPMQPIEEVRRVLAMAPDHPGANYLMGDLRLMRAQFQPEWADSARVSFERVLAVAPPGSELRARAEQALTALASAAAAGATPSAGG